MRLINRILAYESSNFIIVKIQKKLRKIFKIYFVPTNLKNFPKNNYSIGLTYPKKVYTNNKFYFKNLYTILFKNKCNLYITKDETFIDNINLWYKKKYLNSNFFKKNKILSSDFKEKILQLIK